MFCMRCGTQLEDDAKFCIICGAEVDADDGSTTVLTPPQPTAEIPAAPQVQIPATPQVQVPPQAISPIPPLGGAGGIRGTHGVGQGPVRDAAYEQPASKRNRLPLIVVACLLAALLLGGSAYMALSGRLGSLFGDDGPHASSTTHSHDDDTDDGEGDEGGDEADGPGLTLIPVDESEAGSTSEPSSEPATEAEPSPEPAHVGFAGITSASATSTERTDSISSYGAEQVFDGILSTCWAEGAPGDGEGEAITLWGTGTQTFSGFTIFNGYQKTEEIYYWNPRATQMDVLVDGVYIATFDLDDVYGSSQTFYFDEPVDGSEITFRIMATNPGNKYADCSISEIQVF